LQAGEHFRIRCGDALRRPLQALAVRILAKRQQDFAHGALDPREIK
jgi:hypothetical protein